MPRTSTTRVALLIETSTSYGRGLLRGISRFAKTNGKWSLFLEPSGADGSLVHAERWEADGLLVRVHTRRLADRVLKTSLPAVDLGYVIPDLFPWSISNHQQRVGEVAAEHLLACGLRNFGFCGWGPAHPPAKAWEPIRLDAFRRVIGRTGGTVAAYTWPRLKRDREWNRAQPHLAEWLHAQPRPIGIMAANDLRASQLLDAARRAGLRVPEDIAIIGVDNDEMLCELSTPSISSVALNLERIGYEGAGLLSKLMRGRPYPKRPIRIPPLGVMARQSTDVIATDDALIADAVRFIRSRFQDPIDVSDVLNHIGVSRRTLELRFRDAMGCSPYQELHRCRLNHARSLLLETELTVRQIASRCGFPYVENFHAVFRREESMTPSQFRQRRIGASE